MAKSNSVLDFSPKCQCVLRVMRILYTFYMTGILIGKPTGHFKQAYFLSKNNLF